jgi:hypothetical protein
MKAEHRELLEPEDTADASIAEPADERRWTTSAMLPQHNPFPGGVGLYPFGEIPGKFLPAKQEQLKGLFSKQKI